MGYKENHNITNFGLKQKKVFENWTERQRCETVLNSFSEGKNYNPMQHCEWHDIETKTAKNITTDVKMSIIHTESTNFVYLKKYKHKHTYTQKYLRSSF